MQFVLAFRAIHFIFPVSVGAYAIQVVDVSIGGVIAIPTLVTYRNAVVHFCNGGVFLAVKPKSWKQNSDSAGSYQADINAGFINTNIHGKIIAIG